MDFSSWSIDLLRGSATHSSGFTVTVEGNPRDPSAVHPGKFPPGCSSLEQVRLLRSGVEAIARAAKEHRSATVSKPVPRPKPVPSGNRPTLSLKKKTTSPDAE